MLGEWIDGKYYIEGLEYTFPKRPPLKTIRNYGVPKTQQVWVRRNDYEALNWEDGWERRPENLRYLEEELIRIYDGEWIFIDGEPEYLNGMMYFFLQWFILHDSGEYPDFRDTSLYYFRFLEIVVNSRLCTGHTLIKSRRLGATSMIISYLLRKMLIVERKSFGITSKTAEDANSEGAFGFLTAAFEALPVFLKPEIPDKETPKKVLYFRKKSQKGKSHGKDSGLNNRCMWRSPGMNTFDSGAYEDILLDESGKFDRKKTKVDVHKYLPIVTKCVKKGAKVTGKLHLPTTVNPPEDGGSNYRVVWDASDQTKSDYLGQTKSGLYRIMIPAYYGFAGYIDQYGKSVYDTPTPEQQKYLESTGECPDPTIGAKQYQANVRKTLENDPEALQQEIQMNPWDAEEVFEAANERCHFNVANINTRIRELELEMESRGLNIKDDEMGRRGWFKAGPSGKIHWEDDIKGMWYIHKFLPPGQDNKHSIVNGKMIPGNEIFGAAGLDPIDAGRTTVDKGSDACCIIRSRYSSQDPEGTGIPVAMFLGRPEDNRVFHEQVFNGLRYYGVKMLAETSPRNWLDYAIDKGLQGYLYGTKKSNGVTEYGIPNQQSDNTKKEHVEVQQLSSLEDWNKIPYIGLLRNRLGFNIANRTEWDICMADGYALMALSRPFKEIRKVNLSKSRVINRGSVYTH